MGRLGASAVLRGSGVVGAHRGDARTADRAVQAALLIAAALRRRGAGLTSGLLAGRVIDVVFRQYLIAAHSSLLNSDSNPQSGQCRFGHRGGPLRNENPWRSLRIEYSIANTQLVTGHQVAQFQWAPKIRNEPCRAPIGLACSDSIDCPDSTQG